MEKNQSASFVSEFDSEWHALEHSGKLNRASKTTSMANLSVDIFRFPFTIVAGGIRVILALTVPTEPVPQTEAILLTVKAVWNQAASIADRFLCNKTASLDIDRIDKQAISHPSELMLHSILRRIKAGDSQVGEAINEYLIVLSSKIGKNPLAATQLKAWEQDGLPPII